MRDEGEAMRKAEGHTPFVSRSAVDIDFERALGELVNIVIVQA
jgi:hypothetical protein